MFTHLLMGTNDAGKAREFYDSIFAILNYQLVLGDDTKAIYSDGTVAYGVVTPIDGNPACHANGGTIGFRVKSDDMVDEIYQTALAHGGTDAGAPGPREGAGGARGAYVRDPDGNKLCFFNM